MKKNNVMTLVNKDGRLMALLGGLLLDMILLLGLILYICIKLIF